MPGLSRPEAIAIARPDQTHLIPDIPSTKSKDPVDGRAAIGEDSGMQLLERDAVLAALTEYAGDARAGEGRVVLVAGEAGVGKTALLEALRERVPDARWLWGACEGSFTPRPLGPVYDVAALVGGELARACDEDASRQQIFRGLLDELTRHDGLTVLCLEDMHWADATTLDLLRYLAGRLRRCRTLVVVTYRDDGLAPDHPLRITVGELGTQRSTRRIDLPPLSRDAVSRLARHAGIADTDLFELTGGNPFLVTEVIECGWREVPPSAREAVLARVARLSADARKTLEAAAVIGSRVDVALLRQAAEGSTDATDECLTAGALLSDHGTFRFRHEIARRAVEEALPAHRRTELHQRVLDLLLSAGCTDDARLAHHAETAGATTAVLEHAPRAARIAAGLGAHREAAMQYERALRFADDADRLTRAQLLTALGYEHGLIDQWADAASLQEEALSLWREVGDELRAGHALFMLARTYWRLCRGAEAGQAAEDAVELLEQLPASTELGWAYTFLAAVRFNANGGCGDLLDKAQAIAEQFEELPLLATVYNTNGGVKAALGQDGIPDLERALEIALSINDDEQIGRAFANLQDVLARDYKLAEAQRVFDAGMDYCDEHDLGAYEHCLRGGQGVVLDKSGRWDEADELLVFDLRERVLSPINKVMKLLVVGVLDARRGRDSAESILDEALALAEASNEPDYLCAAGLARMENAWLGGDAEGIRREASRALAHASSQDRWVRGAVAVWLRRGGLPDADLGEVAPAYAMSLAGDWRCAADAWHELNVPYEEALALLDSGDRDAMHEALRIFEKLGATATLARAQATMRRLGFASIPRGRRADTRANRFGLTRREQEVLALLTEGLTNADIAARLFIAEKTVDNHVSSVLAKMHVGSRHEAARLVAAV
jgi:DNA-binding CsgD family transcriptional regulator/tetratricopeptide (TPR) repeat protein